MVVDTNVALVANAEAGQASASCVKTCLERLKTVQSQQRVVLDNHGFILAEYLGQRPFGSPRGPGDAFFIWVHDNQANPAHCELVIVTPLPDDPQGFVEFPDDPALAGFDSDDRKFVAAALASSEGAPILNAVDTDWWHFRQPLAQYQVAVEFLCPELMHGDIG